MSLNYLVTIPDATRYLQGQGYDFASDINFEKNIEQYRTAAHKAICGYLGYEVVSTVYTDEWYNGSGTQMLYFKNRPATLLSSVKYDNTVQTLTNFAISSDASFIYYEDGFFSSDYLWKITYTAGYTSTTMPGDIRMAAMKLIFLYYKESGPSGSLGLASQSSPDASSQSYDLEAVKNVLTAIAHHGRYIL